jgi:hypothetical protein
MGRSKQWVLDGSEAVDGKRTETLIDLPTDVTMEDNQDPGSRLRDGLRAAATNVPATLLIHGTSTEAGEWIEKSRANQKPFPEELQRAITAYLNSGQAKAEEEVALLSDNIRIYHDTATTPYEKGWNTVDGRRRQAKTRGGIVPGTAEEDFVGFEHYAQECGWTMKRMSEAMEFWGCMLTKADERTKLTPLQWAAVCMLDDPKNWLLDPKLAFLMIMLGDGYSRQYGLQLAEHIPVWQLPLHVEGKTAGKHYRTMEELEKALALEPRKKPELFPVVNKSTMQRADHIHLMDVAAATQFSRWSEGLLPEMRDVRALRCQQQEQPGVLRLSKLWMHEPDTQQRREAKNRHRLGETSIELVFDEWPDRRAVSLSNQYTGMYDESHKARK